MEVETFVLKWIITDQSHKMLFLENGGSTVICLSAAMSFIVGISCVLYHSESI